MRTLELAKMRDKIRHFVKERDWEQYHNPKNMSIALGVEASELMELFQWLSDREANSIKEDLEKMQKVKEELADIFYWLIRLSDVLELDLETAFWEKMQKNEAKYPVHLCKGKAHKYTELKNKN